jgi:large repetitive protein
VQVANSEVAIQLSVGSGGGIANVSIIATSDLGIQTVTAAVDGARLGSLSAANAGSNTYQFTVDPAHAVSGQHTITAQATDSNGQTASATSVVTFDNPPVLAVSHPFDGMLVNATLHVAGTFTTDKTGSVIVSAIL